MRIGILILLCLCWTQANAQGLPPGPEPPRIGIALGGGGARGLAHIGVLKVLEEAGIPVDYVAGTSMGCAIGALYASGYSPAQVEELALSLDWSTLMQDAQDRRRLPMLEKLWDGRYVVALPIRDGTPDLPSGLRSGEQLTDLLTHLLAHVQHVEDFSDLPVPFGCVATDLQAEEAVWLDRGSLADAVRASMAIPGIFKPVSSPEGRLLVDGGVVRNLPAQDVRAMGSDFVIAVDLTRPRGEGTPPRSIPDVVNRSLRIPRAPLHAAERARADVLIEPEVRERSVLDFENVAWLIAEGEQAARRALPRLRARLDSLSRIRTNGSPGDLLAMNEATPLPARTRAASSAEPQNMQRILHGWPAQPSVYIARVEVQGLRRVSPHLVLDLIDHPVPGHFTVERLQHLIHRIRATELFEQVSYRLGGTPGGERHLVLCVTEKPRHVVRMGLRYDTHSRAGILLNATLRSPTERHMLLLDLEAGTRTVVQVQHQLHLGARIGLHNAAQFMQREETLMDDRDRVVAWRLQNFSLTTSGAYELSPRLLCRIGLEHRYNRVMPAVAAEDVPSMGVYSLRLDGLLWYDSYDRVFFPRRGQHLFYQVGGSRRGWGSAAGRMEQNVDWRVAVPVNQHVTLVSELQFSSRTLTTPGMEEALRPLLETGASLGGPHTPLLETGQFVGLAQHEKTGRHMKAAMVGVQYEFHPGRFAVLRANAGNTFEAWRWDFTEESYVVGGGATFGTTTPLGPAAITIATSTRHTLVVDISLGNLF